jgi:uncharacterized repeat protein (TIGR02543 family)/prepilin-type N-terminal cleavage/methylation domain-containing protein
MRLFSLLFKNRKGLSLVELVATVAIISLVAAGVSVAVVSASRNYSKGNSEVALQQDVQTVTNILNNIIVDSKIARNYADASDAEGASNDKLFVYTTDGSAYQIQLSGGILYYGKTTYAPDAFTVLPTSSMVQLADHVETFTADTTTYGSDYSVKFVLKMNSPTNGREMETTFSVTSRNAGSLGSLLNIVNGASIVCEVQAVIEPWNTIEINYDVFTSGTVTDNDIIAASAIKCYTSADLNDDHLISSGVVTFAKDTTGEVKKLKITATGAIADLDCSKIYVKLDTNANNGAVPYDSRIIEVMVRKAKSVTVHGNNTAIGYDASNTEVDGKFQTGAEYELDTVLNVYNGDRFLGYQTDMDYPSVYKSTLADGSQGNPYTVRYTFAAAGGYSLDDVYVTVPGLYTNKRASEISFFDLDSRAGTTIKVRLGKSMPKGSSLSCIPVATHADYDNTTETARNKANKQYDCTATPWIISPPAASITRGQIGGSPIEGSDASKYQPNFGWARFIDEYYRPALLSAYAGNAEMTEKLNDEAVINAIKDQYGSVDIARFYTIGSVEKPTKPSEIANNYFGLYNGYYWSQYRLLSTAVDNPNWNLETNMSMRMQPDTFYQLEFVDVIYTTAKITTPFGDIPANVIVWPKYDRLLDLGFGQNDSTHKGCLGLNGFWDGAGAVTNSYDDFGEVYPIYPADISFLANPTYGVVNGATSVGSESNPIKVSGTTAAFRYNQVNWKGLTYQSFQNEIGAVVQRNEGGSWVDEAKINLLASDELDLITSYTSNVGSFTVHQTNTQYEIDRLVNKSSTYNKDTIYRLHLNLTSPYSYILDEDGVLSKTVHHTDERAVYNYPDTNGYIYFQVEYPAVDYMYLDYNDGTGTVRSVAIINGGNNKPLNDYPTAEEISAHAGQKFMGWYTDKTYSTKVPNSSNTAHSYQAYWNTTVYAYWVTLGDKVTVNLDPNGGSCSVSSFETYTDGNIPTLPTPTHSNSDYTFAGWFTQKSGGQQVNEGHSYESVGYPTTLYAHWNEVGGITVTFNSNGGNTPSFTSKKVPYNYSAIGDLPTVTRDGYSFLGWYTDPTGGVRVTSNSQIQGLGGATAYYAHWRGVGEPQANITLESSNPGSIWLNNQQYSCSNNTYRMTYVGISNPSVKVTVSAGGTCVYNGITYTGGQSFFIQIGLNEHYTSQTFNIQIVSGSVSFS